MRLIARAMDMDAVPAECIPHDQEPQKSRVGYKSNSSGPVIIQSAAVLEAVKARPGNVGMRSMAERRPALTASVRVAVRRSTVGTEESPAARSNKRKHRTKEGLDKVPLI